MRELTDEEKLTIQANQPREVIHTVCTIVLSQKYPHLYKEPMILDLRKPQPQKPNHATAN